MSSFFFGRLTDWVLRRRGAVAVLIVLLTAFFLWKMQDLQFDNSNEIWFSEGDPSLERINTFHKLFGNDDFVYLVFGRGHAVLSRIAAPAFRSRVRYP